MPLSLQTKAFVWILKAFVVLVFLQSAVPVEGQCLRRRRVPTLDFPTNIPMWEIYGLNPYAPIKVQSIPFTPLQVSNYASVRVAKSVEILGDREKAIESEIQEQVVGKSIREGLETNSEIESLKRELEQARAMADENLQRAKRAELKIAKKKPTLDDLIQMSNEADYEMGDIVVFGMKNHPAYRFDLQGDLKDYMERVRVASTHGGTDHSGFLNMKVSEIADNIDGAAIIAIEDDNKSPFQDGNNIKSMVGWSSADEVYPPNTDDEQSGEDEDGAFASGPDNDQVKMRHLAGLDDF
mgnify:CR=1 FL=1